MKTVLVTGGTRRIGFAIAEELRGRGYRVITSSHRTDAGADIVADLSDPMGPARLFAACLKLLDGAVPDALVNNAALFDGEGDAVERLAFEAPRKLTMMMAGREDGRGAVVNILDSAVLCGAAADGDTPYLRAKRALLDETRRAALAFAATLRVNAVAPGAVLVPEGTHLKAPERLLERRPTPEDVAQAVAYLLEAEAVTGLVLPVDGGESALAAAMAAVGTTPVGA